MVIPVLHHVLLCGPYECAHRKDILQRGGRTLLKFLSSGYTTNPMPFFVFWKVLWLFLGHTQCIVEDSSCEEETRVDLMWTETVRYDCERAVASSTLILPQYQRVSLLYMGLSLFFGFLRNTLQHLHLVLPNLCRALFQCRLILQPLSVQALQNSEVGCPQFVSAFENLGQMAL